MSLQYIIDGYNIIKHPLFTQHADKKIKDPKIKLFELISIQKLCGSKNNKIAVVFDGYPDSLAPIQGAVDVIFSKQVCADRKIRQLVESSPDVKNIRVVSDDKEIKIFSRLLGAGIIGVEEFIRPKQKLKKTGKELLKPELSYSEMHKINKELRQLWLK